MLSGLIRPDGYDFTAIQVVMDSFMVNKERRPQLLSQIIKLIDVIEVEKRKRKNNGPN